MSYETASSLSGEVSEECTKIENCSRNETSRQAICFTCSEQLTNGHEVVLTVLASNITAAAEERCFPSEIVFALVSRLSIEGGALLETGWRQCTLQKYKSLKCYGLMHIPESLNPNENVAGDSVDHFLDGIDKLIELISLMSATFKSFTPSEQTRAGLAAYDAGIMAIRTRDVIDQYTTNGDFSSDIMSRAKRISSLFP